MLEEMPVLMRANAALLLRSDGTCLVGLADSVHIGYSYHTLVVLCLSRSGNFQRGST